MKLAAGNNWSVKIRVPRFARLVGILLLLVMLGLAGGAGQKSSNLVWAASGLQSFVQRSGGRLVLDGQTYQFLGFNRDNAASDASVYPGSRVFHFYCGAAIEDPDAYLNRMFTDITRACLPEGVNPVLRIWAYQRYAVNNLTGELDFSQIDRVVNLARRYNVRLIMTLENQWEDCTLGGQKNNLWYANGYYLWNRENMAQYGHSYAYPLTYRDYAAAIVQRYRDDPIILAWELMNEAESETTGKKADPVSLYRFTQDMAGWIKKIDPNHLVTLGTDSGQAGTTAGNYTWLHSIPEIDLLTSHEYTQDQILPENMVRDFASARALGKPIFAGEVGIPYPDPTGFVNSPEQRAELFRRKMDAYFQNGGSGYLIWSWTNDPVAGTADHSPRDIDRGDPVCYMLQDYSIPPCLACAEYSTRAIQYDWENGSLQGWVREYGALANLLALPGQAHTGRYALMLASVLDGRDGWE